MSEHLTEAERVALDDLWKRTTYRSEWHGTVERILTERIARVRALADEWTCDCDPGPEGQHREWCRSYFGERLAAALAHPSTDPDG